MNEQVVALHLLATAVADDLRAAAAARGYAASVAAAKPAPQTLRPTPGPQAVMARALVNIDSLVAQVRNNPTLISTAQASTVAKLEAQYGNTLGRIVAVVSGLQLNDLKGSNAVVRLIASDPAARAELAHIDPNDGELIETLYDLLVRENRSTKRASRATEAPREVDGAASVAKDTSHMAQLIAERAQYVIPSIIPAAAIADDPVVDDEDADQPVDGVHRVEAVDKSKRQK